VRIWRLYIYFWMGLFLLNMVALKSLDKKKTSNSLSSISISNNRIKSLLNIFCLVIPVEAEKGDTLQIILQVADSGHPSHTRYQRVIIDVIEQ
jgi:hypothetical protein